MAVGTGLPDAVVRFEVLKLAADALRNLLNISVLLCAGLIAYAGATKSGFDACMIGAVALLILAALFAQIGLFVCVEQGETGLPDASAPGIRLCTIVSFAATIVGVIVFLVDIVEPLHSYSPHHAQASSSTAAPSASPLQP